MNWIDIRPLDCHSGSLSQWDGLERCSHHCLEERQQIGWSPKDIHEAMVSIKELKDQAMKAGAI